MTHDADDNRLIMDARQGNWAAFDALVRGHQVWVRGYIARFIYEPEEVFDLAQEVFIEVWKSLARYDPERPLRAWLRGIALNRVKVYARQARRRRNREQVALDEKLFAWQADSEAPARGGDRLRFLRECIDRLQQESRNLVVKRYLDGIGLKELAEAVGKTIEALTMQFMRLRTSLQRCIEQKMGAGS